MQQPNPNPNPDASQVAPYSQQVFVNPNYFYHVNPQNPNSNAGASENVDPYIPVSPYGAAGYEAYHPGAYAHYQTADAAAAISYAYYSDPNYAAYVQSATTSEAFGQYGANPYVPGVPMLSNGTQQPFPVNPKAKFKRPGVGTWKKGLQGNGTWIKPPKKPKVVQAILCEVCKVLCNTSNVLEEHKSGKKHQKNIEKLRQAVAAATQPKPPPPPLPPAPAGSSQPMIGPQDNPKKRKSVNVNKRKKKSETLESLDIKKRRLMESGRADTDLRVCNVCNVVCNSEHAFNIHLAGQRHTALLKKNAPATEV